MVTFGVDEVDPAAAPLPVTPLGERYREALAFGGDAEVPVIAHGETHPLLGAVGIAFAQHRPLVLSPDAVWLTIAQGVAQHVRHNAEALRARLVRHDGKKRLTIECDAMPGDAAGWRAAVGEFRRMLGDEIGEGRARLFECDFSTSGEVERTVSQIVLLDAYSPYYSFWMMCICGIPSITLTGTVADWKRIRERIDVIAELDLAWWCRSLAPIADQFVRAAEGKAEIAFWKRIYNPVDAYGGDVITGWITRFYPYLVAMGSPTYRNPMLELTIDEPRNVTRRKGDRYAGPGIGSSAVPDVRSRVTVHVSDLAGRHQAIALVGGLVGVAQGSDGALQPIAGWHVEPAAPAIPAVIDRITRDHQQVAPQPRAENAHGFRIEGSSELIQLFHHIDSATLFTGDRAWRILPPKEHAYVRIEGTGLSIRRVIDLPGGSSLCEAAEPGSDTAHWLVCRLAASQPRGGGPIRVYPDEAIALDSPAEVRVLAGSLAAILDAALDSGGGIDDVEVCRLDEVLRRQRLRQVPVWPTEKLR